MPRGTTPRWLAGVSSQLAGVPGWLAGVSSQLAGAPGWLAGVSSQLAGVPGWLAGGWLLALALGWMGASSVWLVLYTVSRTKGPKPSLIILSQVNSLSKLSNDVFMPGVGVSPSEPGLQASTQGEEEQGET